MQKFLHKVAERAECCNALSVCWRTLLRFFSRSIRASCRESQLPDQAVRSQPILIIVLTQSSGKYELHSRMFPTERTLPALIVRLAISVV